MRPIVYICILLLVACQNNTSNTNGNNNDDHHYMINYLDSLVTNGNPVNYYHWNNKRANMLLESMKKDNQVDVNKWFQYCMELLNAGKTEQCIATIQNSFGTDISAYADIIDDKNYVIFELLVLAFLRLGEQQNCQQLHNEYSCIIPFHKKAIYKHQEGPRKAIEIAELVLTKHNSNKIIWLLNLAYMTLGINAQEIDEKYRLNIAKMKVSDNKNSFIDVSKKLSLDVSGLSGGVCSEDFNNDGFIDIAVSSYGMNDPMVIFWNQGNGRFDKADKKANLSGINGGLNMIHADYNNDGFEDIFILRGGWLGDFGNHPNSLLKNNGDQTFTDVTYSIGLFDPSPTQTATWIDYNNDGFLDLFIGNESKKSKIYPSKMFKNEKGIKFTDVTNEIGLGDIHYFVKGTTSGDINNDGYPELFISICGGKNLLFKNNKGFFENISQSAGIEEPIYSFPCWFWDVNNDGYEDIFVSGYDTRNLNEVARDITLEMNDLPFKSELPRLFINMGNETFSEQSKKYGLDKLMFSMGSNFGDFNNDGFLDFYVGTGAPDFSSIVPNRMFENVNGNYFNEVTYDLRVGHIQKGHGIAFADVDNDGDQDIYMVLGGAFEGDQFTNVLFENKNSNTNWVNFELEGTESNRSAIGAKLKLKLNDQKYIYSTVNSGGSFGASSLEQEMGIGQEKQILELTIYWPSGSIDSFKDISINKKYKIKEGTNQLESVVYNKINF